MYGAIEAGGTKWVCAAGTGPDDLADVATFPTTTPHETIGRAVDFLRRYPLVAVGVGAFGPVDLQPGSPTLGWVTTTPKPGWRDVDLRGALVESLRLPIGFDTDVNAAALGEHCWGAARGLSSFVYLTVGTGIGGGLMIDGKPVHGLIHPEVGHMRVPHDREADPFAGICPFHGDCLEGLASGEAMRARWGRPAEDLDEDAPWRLEAGYLALAVANITFVLSPEVVIVGGGVATEPRLLPLVRGAVGELLGRYLRAPKLNERLDEYIVEPALGVRAGVLGALELGRRSAGQPRTGL
jgi:fructokinase